ncbi:uncharacterized protein LOC142223837 [Haematobia irritans]|uniref:uncharacterized protein LOC142223837 n=1 Tax=Haematobia irritans TaxID=7368 RepID=UPI003F508C24
MAQNLFSPHTCNVCLMLKACPASAHDSILSENPTNFSVCTGCNLVKYCGKNHQKLDWQIHKEFCRAVMAMKKALKISHPLMITSKPPASNVDMELTITQMKYLIKSTLERPLESHEEEITSYPAYCPICFGFKSVNVICPHCKGQAYCSEKHMKKHAEEHSKLCGVLTLYYTPYKAFPLPKDYEMPLKQSVGNLHEIDLVETFERAFQCKLPLQPTHNKDGYQLFAYAASFSCIFTICYILSYMDMDAYDSSNFIIFIVGSSVEASLWFTQAHCKFFFHQYPQIKTLDLYFIGPELVDATPNRCFQFDYKDSERIVNFYCFKGLFQQYCQYYKVKAQLVIAFNCGFSEFSNCTSSSAQSSNLNTHAEGNGIANNNGVAELNPTSELNKNSSVQLSSNLDQFSKLSITNDTWFRGLIEILQTFDTPIVFTSFTKQEALFDFAALLKASEGEKLKIKIERIFKLHKNPFRDLRPQRHWKEEDDEKIFYRNGYIQAIRSKLL